MINMGMLILSYKTQEGVPMFIQNFKILVAVGPKKSLTKNSIGEKEKWKNIGNNKHEDADCVLHNTTSHIQCLYQISKP